MIHFTADGIFVDIEEERLEFYDEMCRGNPVILGHILLHEMTLEATTEVEDEHQRHKRRCSQST